MASAIGGLTSPINHAVPEELGIRLRLRDNLEALIEGHESGAAETPASKQ
jgi:hypothetical protein